MKLNTNHNYIKYLKLRGLSSRTIEAYWLFYCKFISKYKKKIKKKILDRKQIEAFCYDYNHGLARAFLNNFLEYIDQYELKKYIPRLRKKKYQQKLIKWLPRSEIRLLVDSSRLRDSLIVSLLFECGLRESELISIKVKDIDIKNSQIRVIGKGNKEALVKFSEKSKELLKRYITEEYLFPHSLLFTLTRHGIINIIGRLGIQHLKKKVTPHMLRHSLGYYLKEQGFDLKDIQIILRHEKLETTGIYTGVDHIKLNEKIKGVLDGANN
jgi:site-specific recombinase XerD